MALTARLQSGETLGDRVMKVDHAGEHGAICIYRAQRWFARWRAPDMVGELDRLGVLEMGAPEGDIQVAMKRMNEWEKKDYHQPGDSVQANWAWVGAETVAEVMAILGWRISETEKMPEWLPTGRFAKLERGNTKDLPKEQ